MIPLLLALSCFPVDGPKLLTRHLAAALAEFAQIAPEVELGYAPMPGAIRVIRADEVQAMAVKHGLAVTPAAGGVCFEWPMAPLDPVRATDAMRLALPDGARLDVLGVSRMAVPPGPIEFPIDMLKAGYWRGYVRYGAGSKFDIWARVSLSVKQTRVVAATAIKAGDRITASQVRLEEIDAFPDASYVPQIEEAVGMVSKRSYVEGSPLTARMLGRPAAVLKGDAVRLHAAVGAAQVSMEVHAQAAGKIGDWIPVKNPSSGRVLRARVESAGEVTLAQ
jgi:flagella basal body P-ring formation protein FlgA